jgi:hypothetical protein
MSLHHHNRQVIIVNANGETAMILFVTGPDYRLPFETFVLERFTTNHVHRDRQNFKWTEKMDLTVHCLALGLCVVAPANNDNEHGSGSVLGA